MSNRESLRSFLRDSRKKKNISMRALARDAEISVAYLSKIEQDAANPTISVLERIAAALGVPVSDLTMFIRSQNVDAATASNTPESLKKFIEKYSEQFPQLLDPDYHRALSGIRFRGKYPENDNEWLTIFMSILNVLEK